MTFPNTVGADCYEAALTKLLSPIMNEEDERLLPPMPKPWLNVFEPLVKGLFAFTAVVCPKAELVKGN